MSNKNKQTSPADLVRNATEVRAFVQNAVTSRIDLMRTVMGGWREYQIDNECGYPQDVSPQTYKLYYKREGIAARVVSIGPDSCWAKKPDITDTEESVESPFQQAIKDLDAKHKLFSYMHRIDELSGIGRFGILLIGIDDGKKLDEPVEGINEWGEGEHGNVTSSADDEEEQKLLGDMTPQPEEGDEEGMADEEESGEGHPEQYKASYGSPESRKLGKARPGEEEADEGPQDATEEATEEEEGGEEETEEQVVSKKGNKTVRPFTKNSRLVRNEAPDFLPNKGRKVQDEEDEEEEINEKDIPGSGESLRDEEGNEEGEANPNVETDEPDDVLDEEQEIPEQEDGGDILQGPDKKPAHLPTRKLLYLRPFDESLVLINQFETNPDSPRYGKPLWYSINFIDSTQWGTVAPIGAETLTMRRVHWTRVIHVAENTQSSEIFGLPRMEKVFNRLYDLKKILGGSAEMFWKGGFPGIALEVNPDVPDAVIDKEALGQEMNEYMEGLKRYIALTGISAKSLTPQIADPNPHVQNALNAICISIKCPKRIFTGTEEGQLAGAQDALAWAGQVEFRRANHVEPNIIRAVIDRLVAMDVLPQPQPDTDNQTYIIKWPDLTNPSAVEKAQVAATLTGAFAQYVSGQVDNLIPPVEYFKRVIGMSEDEANKTVEAAEKFLGVNMQDAARKMLDDKLNPPQEVQKVNEDGEPVDDEGNVLPLDEFGKPIQPQPEGFPGQEGEQGDEEQQPPQFGKGPQKKPPFGGKGGPGFGKRPSFGKRPGPFNKQPQQKARGFMGKPKMTAPSVNTRRPIPDELDAMNQAAHHSVVETTKQIVRNMDPDLKQTRKMKDAVNLSTLAINEQVKMENSKQASPSDKARVAKLHRMAGAALNEAGALGGARWHTSRSDEIVGNGGSGSGNFGHEGRPGKRGGSGGGKGASGARWDGDGYNSDDKEHSDFMREKHKKDPNWAPHESREFYLMAEKGKPAATVSHAPGRKEYAESMGYKTTSYKGRLCIGKDKAALTKLMKAIKMPLDWRSQARHTALGKALGYTDKQISHFIKGQDSRVSNQLTQNGGPGSGDFNHMGRPGKRGGSADGETREAARSTSSGLHPVRADAIADYVGTGYETMNMSMRKGKVGSVTEKRIAILKQCFSPTKKATTLYRGAALPPEAFAQLKVGATFRDKGFISTSKSSKVALERVGYYTAGTRKKEVIFHIETPKGAKVIDVPSLIGDSQFEKEVILQPNSRFRVKSIRTAKRFGEPYTECVVEHIPYGG